MQYEALNERCQNFDVITRDQASRVRGATFDARIPSSPAPPRSDFEGCGGNGERVRGVPRLERPLNSGQPSIAHLLFQIGRNAAARPSRPRLGTARPAPRDFFEVGSGTKVNVSGAKRGFTGGRGERVSTAATQLCFGGCTEGDRQAYGEAGRGVSGGFADWPTGMLTGRALGDVSVRQVLSLRNQLPSPVRRFPSLVTLFARKIACPGILSQYFNQIGEVDLNTEATPLSSYETTVYVLHVYDMTSPAFGDLGYPNTSQNVGNRENCLYFQRNRQATF
ncbi:hypothetical protein HPB50_024499 [Hyalomma asiaticum]|uniref:Uncharacterized protein n=1 Tax=Hyalomma asiaticum TaxID=266040 RepID=A0ACB7SZM0_HYAAI|nr:hypothetical protein HPB50_024499 [Hyalomma asiaticum]